MCKIDVVATGILSERRDDPFNHNWGRWSETISLRRHGQFYDKVNFCTRKQIGKHIWSKYINDWLEKCVKVFAWLSFLCRLHVIHYTSFPHMPNNLWLLVLSNSSEFIFFYWSYLPKDLEIQMLIQDENVMQCSTWIYCLWVSCHELDVGPCWTR